VSPVTAGATLAHQTPAGGGRFPRLLPPPPTRLPIPASPSHCTGHSGELAAHLGLHGPVPYRGSAGALIAEVRAAGLTGRGGAAFPVHRKLEAVAAARPGRAIVVGNGAEGEPASHKDEALLFLAPHLVLDGLQLAAEAVGAGRAVLYVRDDLRARTRLEDHLPERDASGLDRVPVEIVWSPRRFLAGEESALASRVSGGPAVPRFTPPRVFTHGVDGRPTLVQNVETLAHLALIARYGAAWFRAMGTPDEPGTMLCTLRQASGSVDVAEAAIGTPLATLLDLPAVKGDGEVGGAVLVGGYHGAWVPAAQAARLTLSNAELRPAGAFTGAGVLAGLPADRCGLIESARVARYLALESAGQCGPCRSGLPSIAAAMADLANEGGVERGREVGGGWGPEPRVLDNLTRWAGLVEGRGACHHPDGTVRFLRSALRVFGPEVRLHQQGRCSAATDRPFLPVPAGPSTEADWS
jgi:NADH:ubiquinone oxidoreductase subunit F (NADH-binding)